MNITNIKADIDFLCGSTSATYADVNKIRNINIAYNDVARLMWESDSTWRFVDNNGVNPPEAYRSLGDTSASYAVPTNAMRIHGASVLDNNGTWVKLTPLPTSDILVDKTEYLNTPGLPIHYNLEGTDVTLFPAPASGFVTLTSGLKLSISPSVTEFPVSATTSEPAFPSSFHRILSYAAVLDFTQDEKQKRFAAAQKQRLEQGLTRFITKRATEFKNTIQPRSKRFWRQYI